MKVHRIVTPLQKDVIGGIRAGDKVLITGRIVTARDAAHKFMVEKRPGFIRKYLDGGIIYHCGPIVKRVAGGWKVVCAGPTTSIREEPYTATVIRLYSLRAIIGKGGMGNKTLGALRTHSAMYLHAVGGAAVYITKFIEGVEDVFMLEEFGAPEALWVLRVRDFPAIVTMDSQGGSIHEKVAEISKRTFQSLINSSKPVVSRE